MSDPTSRMLRLLSLLQTHRHWPAGELAERLGVTARTIRRDVDRLRDLGYPVASQRGIEGGYRLEAGSELPPLLLDDEEAVAIAIGLRTAAQGVVTGIEESSVRALAKLEQVLPSRLRRRVNALHDYTVPLTAAPKETVDPEALATITLACRDRERLRFRYSAHDGATTRRMTDPHRLVSTGRRWYMVAWDITREDWRTFRVDRIDELQPTGVRFTERDLPGGDAAAFVEEAIRGRFQIHEIAVRLHAPMEAMAQRVPPWGGTLEAVDGTTCVLRGASESLEWTAMLLGTLGVDFDVLEPAALTDCVAVIGERFARAAPGGDA